jgi:hypothetical protein
MAEPQEPAPVEVSAELLTRLARYGGHEFPSDRATQLAPMLAGALAALRALRLDGYDDLQPAATFRVPGHVPGRVPPEA